MKNILVIKLSAIGDVIHALPVAAALKEKWPDCHLTWVVSPVAAAIVENSPAIDEIIIFERKNLNSLKNFIHYIGPFSKCLQKRQYDLSIDLQGLLKSALIAYLAHAKKKLGYADMREGSGFISHSIKGENRHNHIVERYLDTVRYLGYAVDNVNFPLGITNDDERAAQILCQQYALSPKTYVILVVGANWTNKRWPAANFANFANHCNAKGLSVLLAGYGKIDEHIAAEISALTIHTPINLIGKTTLKVLACLMKNAVAVVGGDTGNLHMAAALKIPAIMLMGPTDPMRNGPYGQPDNVLTVTYDCKFCWKRKCRYKRDCLAQIKPSQVIEKLNNLLS